MVSLLAGVPVLIVAAGLLELVVDRARGRPVRRVWHHPVLSLLMMVAVIVSAVIAIALMLLVFYLLALWWPSSTSS